jgi:malonate-semialdehyde dehydrogenase (acetylating)/methylmalonate-semialdehyde dehydrogenase
VQAAGGAKNHVLVMPDAEMKPTVQGILHSAFGCAGERCMAGSLLIAVGDVADDLVERLCAEGSKITVGRTDLAESNPGMGPLISRQHLERVRDYIDGAEREGGQIVLDGRKARHSDGNGGFFLGPTIIDRVRPEMAVAREEVFGPVLPIIRVENLQEAIDLGHRCEYGNGAAIFTTSGRAARIFKHKFSAGMIGVNVGVPAPMAWFPFTGYKNSFFGDLHIQGKEGLMFYTQQRMVMTRWFEPTQVDKHDPVWRPGRR